MPPHMTLEVFSDHNHSWVKAGEVALGDRDGSISSNSPEGRDVYIFGVNPLENQGYIKRSEFGLDTVESKLRRIDSVEFVTIAALNSGETHELSVVTDKSPIPRRIRFTYFED